MSTNPFYPRADAGFGYGRKDVSLPLRPQTSDPMAGMSSVTEPLACFDAKLHAQSYIPGAYDDGTPKIPSKPDDFSDPYLYPMLTRNERLRLTMLWYYTRELVDDEELLHKMQEKVHLLKSLIGWEFAICGLLENDIYRRIATAGLPLASVPRRESPCSHTVQQASDSVFFLPDMSDDWRFAQSPQVTQGGLRTYAGAQLRCQVDDGEDIALGSLCIASSTPGRTLDPSQLEILVKFADMLTEDVVNASRRKRAKQQEQNDVLLREAIAESLRNPKDSAILRIVSQVFPNAHISLSPVKDRSIQLQAGGPSIQLPQLPAESALWEDHGLIDELLQTKNHKKLNATQPIRAIIGIVPNNSSNTALVVSTTDITCVFDDIDIRFVEGCVMILRSITQERSLQEALKTRERFMRGITHQLRTPIHGILGSVDLLADEMEQGAQQEATVKSMNNIMAENLRMIKSSGVELMSTVNNVIKFNRWTELVSNPKAATLSDLNVLESEILEDVSWLLPEDHLDRISIFFLNKLPVEVGIVQMDTVLVKDCLQSLVLNALQNTEQGSVIIMISVTPDYSSIIFDVQDSGCGIASDEWQRVFDAYEKGDAHSSGAGLGLTLARNIADTLGGAVTLVSSVQGKGSHFRAEFQNPGLACLRESVRPAVTTMSDLPERFAIIPSDPPSILDEHFAHFLQARGLQQTDEAAGALAIVSFTHLFDQYQELLRQAEISLLAISLVPAGNDLSVVKTTHPHILFFSGPFTSSRLDVILAETRDAFVARNPPTTIEQTSSSEVIIEARPKALEGDLVTPDLLSRHNPTTIHDSIPNCLIVDDNMINLRIMRAYCDKRQFPYRSAVDGLEAIEVYKEAAKDTPISLILLDLQMPKCDGIQACEEIRSFEAGEGLSPAVIFIVTGQDSPEDKRRSFAAGANKFFVKPLSLRGLDRGIAELFPEAI